MEMIVVGVGNWEEREGVVVMMGVETHADSGFVVCAHRNECRAS